MKDDRVYRAHIRAALVRIAEHGEYAEYGRGGSFRDRRTQDAVVRNLEVVGEVAKRVPSAVKLRAPDVQWKVMAGMRDKLIHEYLRVNVEIV